MLAGTELRKERRLGEVLTDSFGILSAYWRQLAIVSVPVVVANIAFALVLLALTEDTQAADGTGELTADDALDLLLLLVALAIAVPGIFVLQQLVTGGSVVFLDETDRGVQLTPADALDRAQANLGPLVGASLRAIVIVFLLCITVVGIPFGIYRIVRWIFLAQVIMIEGLRGQAVLARSADLVQGRWWNTLGRLIVVALVISLPVGLLQQAFVEAAPGVIGTTLSAATGFITIPFGIIGMSLMYFDLRARKGEDDRTRTSAEPAS